MTALLQPHPATRRAEFRPKRGWWVIAVVIALLGFYFFLTLAAARHKGLSYDEGEQIALGYDMWMRRDHRMEGANGDLVKRWAALPLLVSRPVLPGVDNPWWREGAAYRLAFDFFFNEGNNPSALLRQCRTMVALLGVALGALVFHCSRRLFGVGGGLLSLVVFVGSPSMLAFGGIVSTEIATCLALLGSAWFGWQLLHAVTWRRLAASIGFAAMLVLAKPTAVILFPLAAVLVTLKLIHGRPIYWHLSCHRLIERRTRQAALFAALIALHIAAGWGAIWAMYDFRYTGSPMPQDPGVTSVRGVIDPIDPIAEALLTWSREHHALPEGYIAGIELLLGQNESQTAFMNGQWKIGGWRSFFPYAMWVKTPPPMILLLIVAVAASWCCLRHKREAGADAAAQRRRDLVYAAAPLIGLIVLYFAIAVTWSLNIGFRHILPIYPAAYVLTGGAVWAWRHHRLGAALVAVLLTWQVITPLQIYPHFLAYFSPVVGGPEHGYEHLVDSSLDWGMDLPGLKQWLDEHNPGDHRPFYLAYFGVGNPDYYHIKSLRLPGRPNWRSGASFPMAPGIYAISATLLQGIGTPTAGPWNKSFEIAYWRSLENINQFDQSGANPAARAALLARYSQAFWNAEYARFDHLRFGRLCAWLRHHRPPDDHVGYSILIWYLSRKDIMDIGLGPPAELAPAPLFLGERNRP